MLFDATGTTGLSNLDYVGANWTWDFDDPTSLHHGTIGFIVAHVFDNPGTYNVSTTVQDLSGAVGQTSTTITVSAMTGPTYYVASNGSDTANDGKSVTAPFKTVAHALTLAAPNVSILSRRGDSFSIGSSQLNISTTGPFLLGAYTDPSAPSTAAPIFNSSSIGIIGVTGTDDRLTDLHLVGSAAFTGGIVSQKASNTLSERIEIQGTATGGSTFGSSNTAPNFFVVDCNAHDFQGYGYFGTFPIGFVMIGTTLNNFTGHDHGIRVQGGGSGIGSMAASSYVAENVITPNSAFTGSGVQFRGDDTNFVFVNNYVTFPVGFHPQTNTAVEHVSNGLAEGNTFNYRYLPLTITAQNIYVRNNLFVGPDNGILAEGYPGVLPANWTDKIYVYNNTQYNFPAAGVADNYADVFVAHRNTTGNIVIQNNILSTGMVSTLSSLVTTDHMGTETFDHNLIFAPNSGGTLTTSNVGANGVVQKDPMFASTDLTNPNAFQLLSGSPAINAGTTTPVYRDFTRHVTRPQGSRWDIGAFEFPQAGSDAGVAQDASPIATAAVLAPAQTNTAKRKVLERPPASR